MKNIKRLISSLLTVVMLTATMITAMPLVSDAATQAGWQWPVTGHIFGRGWSSSHFAIDIEAGYGTPVVAAKAGTVHCASTVSADASHYCSGCGYKGSGYHVVIQHDNGYYSFYAHLSSVSVYVGQYVSGGQRIGGVGSTGNSTGNHLHFGISTSGLYNLTDPLKIITPFSDVTATGITYTDATLTGTFGAAGPTMETAGFYIGTSKSNMTKITESLYTNGYDANGNAIIRIYYNLNKWYGTLSQNTTYYYKMYITRDGGVEYSSDIYSFTTGGPTHTHKWNTGVVTKSPTCTATGIKTYTCSGCGETKTETLAKTTHTPGEWTKTVEPTYIQKGTEVQSCKVCGVQLDKRSIPMLTYVNTFTDVKDGAWYSDEVEYVAKRGYMNGMSETEFSPNTNITREQFIMILANYAKANLPNYVGKTGFSDVPEGRWYSNAIQWARKKGYTDGVGNGKFGLGQEVTREQIAKFLYNYAEVKGRDVSGRADITGYTDDTRVSSWALQAVKWAVYNGIITSTKNDSYVIAPRETTTRAQAARMFMIFNETK